MITDHVFEFLRFIVLLCGGKFLFFKRDPSFFKQIMFFEYYLPYYLSNSKFEWAVLSYYNVYTKEYNYIKNGLKKYNVIIITIVGVYEIHIILCYVGYSNTDYDKSNYLF